MPVVLGEIASRLVAASKAGDVSSVAVGATVGVVTEEEEEGRAVCAEEREASTDRMWEAGPCVSDQ